MFLKDSKTAENLKAAFAYESQGNRRYLYFAAIADLDGNGDVARAFRTIADRETTHAYGLLDFLQEIGDPVTGAPFETVRQALEAAISREIHEATKMYPAMAQTARDEGYVEVANWFDTLATSGRGHAEQFQKILADLA
ncbi:MAG: rubrerythrin family protein [Alphaproteobacteria bacterium]|nr:rubrerythrin family protein [Alphaproteobacteria bacterium]